MNTHKEVGYKDILKKVMTAISHAKHDIFATMNLKEEMINPLPSEYFFLLKTKAEKGVHITRLGFGTKEEYEKFLKKNPDTKNYQNILAHSDNYKRMILIDKEKLFYAIEEGSRRIFFFTENKEYIKRYLKYFKAEMK